MGKIKNFFSNKRKKNTDELNNEQTQLDEEVVSYKSQLESAGITSNNGNNTIKDSCQQIVDSTMRLEDLKSEYQAVTEYLTDIQKIELLDGEDREVINDLARNIMTHTKERDKYQKSSRKLNDRQIDNIAQFEEVIEEDLDRIKKWEIYSQTVQKDMNYLESEKAALFVSQEEIEHRQTYLKGIAITTSAVVIILFLLFVIVNQIFHADMQIPFLLTICMAFVSAVYIIFSGYNNRKEMKVTQLKLNRAILLLNKVKIKYINNTNALEYSYEKYMVKSYAELLLLWEEYQKEKEDERRYQLSTDKLDYYNRELVKNLRNYNLYDTKIWIHQPKALLDNKEMVEVRHRLNARRQKLREQIDYNNQLKDTSTDEVNKYLMESDENKEEVIELLKKFGIYL